MAERDVVLRISTKAAPGAGDGFKKVAADAQKTQQAVNQLDSGFRKVASGVAGLGAIALSSDKDVKKLLETFIAFRSIIDIFEGIKASVIGASVALKGFSAVSAAAGGVRGGGGVVGNVAAGAAGGVGVGLLANPITAALLLGGLAVGASAFPEATLGLARGVGLFPSLDEGDKAVQGREAQQRFITEQRENITKNAEKLFELQEKLNGAIRDETKLRIDALNKQREQLKEQQTAAREFGALSPFEQTRARNVARALAGGRGGQLSADQLRFAGGLSALRPAVEQFTEQRAAVSPIFQEILRLRPNRPEDLIQKDIDALEQRATEAGRAIQAQVNQAIQVDISQNPESLATQIARTILPQLVELNQRTVASLEKQIRDLLGNLRAGTRATFGIAKQP